MVKRLSHQYQVSELSQSNYAATVNKCHLFFKGNDNAWIIGIRNLHLWMHGEPAQNRITNDLDAFTEPHRHCIVWKRNAYMKVTGICNC